MTRGEPNEAKINRLRKQRNLFVTLAVLSVASMGFAVPRKVASYRELKAINAHIVDLQAAIVDNQRQIRDVQDQILKAQQEIRKQQSR
jgi:hypothetical protein